MTGEYEQYDGSELPWELRDVPLGEDRAEAREQGITLAPTEGGWCVVVDYAIDVDAARTRTAVVTDDLDTRDAAVDAARRTAFDFEPPHPLRPQHREVFEVADGFLVVVHGAMTDYPFSVRVARFVGVRAHG